jgi:hypothetical protein
MDLVDNTTTNNSTSLIGYYRIVLQSDDQIIFKSDSYKLTDSDGWPCRVEI